MKAVAGQLGVRLLVFGALWWILVEGDLGSPLLAVASIVLAAAASMVLVPGGRPPSLVGLALLAPFFVRESILGGIDVLRRALHPRLPLRPGFVDLSFRLESKPARALVASITSLLPGSLSAELHDDRLRIHVLDTSMAVPDVVRRLEEHVARVFAESITDGPS